jgi:exodeoxyribonuclease VII small subunit
MATEKFETTLARLEKIVQRLEDETVDLDEALKAFEDGIRLAKQCVTKLDEAQKRVEVLLKESDEMFATEALETGDDEDDA